MTSDAVSSTAAHTGHPVRLAARCDGKTAVVSVSAQTNALPSTPWSAGSPLVEDLLGRLQQRTRHCGAEVRLTPDGSQTTVWFSPPRKSRGLGRLLTKP